MSRSRDTNHAYIYTHFSSEADHEHAAPVAGMHMLRRGTSYSAASSMRAILANDDRPPHHAPRSRANRPRAADIGRAAERGMDRGYGRCSWPFGAAAN